MNDKIYMSNLEWDVVDHCLLRCMDCSHQSPLKKPYFMPIEELKHDIEIMKQFVRVKQGTLIGGEPLLHPKIIELAHVLRDSKISETVHIVTNGILLDRQPDEFWSCWDTMQLDVYPGKLTDKQIEGFRDKANKFRVKIEILKYDKFFEQFKKEPFSNSETETIWKQCGEKYFCRIIHHGWLYLCAQSNMIPSMRDEKYDEQSFEDGLRIEGVTYEQLKEFLKEDRKYPNSCKHCLVGHRPQKWYSWREAKNKKEWIEGSIH